MQIHRGLVFKYVYSPKSPLMKILSISQRTSDVGSSGAVPWTLGFLNRPLNMRQQWRARAPDPGCCGHHRQHYKACSASWAFHQLTPSHQPPGMLLPLQALIHQQPLVYISPITVISRMAFRRNMFACSPKASLTF